MISGFGFGFGVYNAYIQLSVALFVSVIYLLALLIRSPFTGLNYPPYDSEIQILVTRIFAFGSDKYSYHS